MKLEARVLTDPHGAILGPGPKVAAQDGIHRACNDAQRVFDAWCRHKHGGRLPRLADLYPGELWDLLPNILVVDVLPQEQDYRYRIVGALEAETRGSDPTGRTVREVYADYPAVLAFCLETYELAVMSPWGIIDFSVEASGNPRYLELDTLFLPLSEDGRDVTQILVYSHFVEH